MNIYSSTQVDVYYKNETLLKSVYIFYIYNKCLNRNGYWHKH